MANNGQWCRLSGIVTEVGQLPTLEEWAPPDCDGHCGNPNCVKISEMCPCQRQQIMTRTLSEFGTIHGQTLISYACLNFDFYHKEGFLPFKRGRIYKVTYEADEGKGCFWCVKKIEDVTDSDTDLPVAFNNWTIGRQDMIARE